MFKYFRRHHSGLWDGAARYLREGKERILECSIAILPQKYCMKCNIRVSLNKSVVAHTAFGMEAEAEEYSQAYDPGLMLFMDFRRHHSGSWDGAARYLEK